MDEELFKLHAKNAAQDVLLMDLMLLTYARLGLSNDEVKSRFENIRDLISKMSIPEIGPAYSDHVSDEILRAVEPVLKGVSESRGIHQA